MKILTATLLALFSLSIVFGQSDRWQQRAEYKMDIDFNVKKGQFKGVQTLKYFNNSPDELTHVFYHLYFNAFQPGSMMDVRSRTINDPDPRVGKRIESLDEKGIGYHKIKSLTMNGKACDFEVSGTILEVKLPESIKAGEQAIFKMEFDSQVPNQIRRSGKHNKEGIEFSMTQWYPKMCEYDYQGWHANPYIGREFHGIWGDFDIKLKIDRTYTVAGTGVVQNPNEVGHGYETGKKLKRSLFAKKKITWHLKAENVHDFAWAADPDYVHVKRQVENGPMLRFFYQKNDQTANWEQLPEIMEKALGYIEEHYGEYPYPHYAFIQGGDGGMEYPMATLITGHRNIGSLTGVSVHELMHAWYQGMMATNEALYAWMDEGFTSYASARVMSYLKNGNVAADAHNSSYMGYINLTLSGNEEPMSTHADHFNTNYAYSLAAYTKGAVFVHQLGYIIGDEHLEKGLLNYYNDWKFKHPNINDFIRVMEKQSEMELDWYKEHWVNTTNTIDYGVKKVTGKNGKTTITLEKVGNMPMPLDIKVTLEDGSSKLYNIPLRIMRGEKTVAGMETLADWPWTNPTYDMVLPFENVKSVEIDPTYRMADVNRNNNVF